MKLPALMLTLMLCGAMTSADWVDNAIDVTAVSQTIQISGAMMTLWVKNTGANEIFVCPWRNDQAIAACTSTIGRRLDAGDAKSWTANAVKGQFWQAVSLIASTGETSTAIGDSLP